jgi:SRSO17 transposase
LLHFVGEGNWCDEKVLAKVREMIMPTIERHGPIEAWIIDDTGFPKKGRHSVGVARQYCGELGKQDNCQIAVTLSIANHHASLPVAYRLYLPKEWATDPMRRRQAGVPKEITFKTKPAIALEQLRWACAAGLPHCVVLMDAGYGTDTELGRSHQRTGLGTGDLQSCCGVMASINRFRSRSLRLACHRMLGARLRGGKARRSRYRRALPVCGFVRRIETTGSLRAGLRSGC